MRPLFALTLLFFCMNSYSFACLEDINKCKALAAKGDDEAMFQLAEEYANGENSVKKDVKKATELMSSSAKKGNVKAQFIMGNSHYNIGLKIENNQKKALLKHLKPDTRKNLTSNSLNDLHDKVIGDNENFKIAFKWFQKAAKKNHSPSENFLAVLYNTGNGVKRNPKKAFQLFLKAAEKQYATAQFNLAGMYQYGTGTPKDLEKAFCWYSISSKNGYKNAKEYADKISTKLNTKQLITAEKNIIEMSC